MNRRRKEPKIYYDKKWYQCLEGLWAINTILLIVIAFIVIAAICFLAIWGLYLYISSNTWWENLIGLSIFLIIGMIGFFWKFREVIDQQDKLKKRFEKEGL